MSTLKDLKQVLVDNSFVTRLLKEDDDYHLNVLDYYKYFLEHNIAMLLSTIIVSEYAVIDDPDNLLSLGTFQILEFDYGDAKLAGQFFASMREDQTYRSGDPRNVVINDTKLFGQIANRRIDGFITKDRKAIEKKIPKLKEKHGLSVTCLDLSIPLNSALGVLF